MTGLFDDAINNIVSQMEQNSFLKTFFPLRYGRAERHVRYEGNKKIVVPAVYVGEGEYIDVRPHDTANSSFWYIHDGQQIVDSKQCSRVEMKATVSVVFWYRLSVDERNTDMIKSRLIYFLNNISIPDAEFTVRRVYENVESVFKDYTVNDGNVLPYLMHPYAGLRIEGEMKVRQGCVSFPDMRERDFNNDYNKDFD